MLKNRKNVSIPDLRRKQSMINLEQINPYAFAMIGLILFLFIISVLCVTAYPNSNFPASI